LCRNLISRRFVRIFQRKSGGEGSDRFKSRRWPFKDSSSSISGITNGSAGKKRKKCTLIHGSHISKRVRRITKGFNSYVSSTRISGEITLSVAAHIARYSEHPKELSLDRDARGTTISNFFPLRYSCDRRNTIPTQYCMCSIKIWNIRKDEKQILLFFEIIQRYKSDKRKHKLNSLLYFFFLQWPIVDETTADWFVLLAGDEKRGHFATLTLMRALADLKSVPSQRGRREVLTSHSV